MRENKSFAISIAQNMKLISLKELQLVWKNYNFNSENFVYIGI